MELIKKLTIVKNGSLSLSGLEELNDRRVEVTISPVTNQLITPQEQRKNLFRFKGAIETNFTNTSENIG